MKNRILNLVFFVLIVLFGIGCTSMPNVSKMKNTILGAKDSIVTNVKKTFLGTRNSIISFAQKSPITRNNKDQDFLFAQHGFICQTRHSYFLSMDFFVKHGIICPTRLLHRQHRKVGQKKSVAQR